MTQVPRSMRLVIGLFGRANAGKSSLLNNLSGQDVALTSPVPGTTTDAVEKAMELRPLGPVLFVDTAGFGDTGTLGGSRMERSRRVFDRADIAVLVTAVNELGSEERAIVSEIAARGVAAVPVITGIDRVPPTDKFLAELEALCKNPPILCDARNFAPDAREKLLTEFTDAMIRCAPEDFVAPPPLVGDLLPKHGMLVMIVPVDIQAPKGRLILPQVQTLRDGLDADCRVLTVKETDYAEALADLRNPPDLVVCDSQVVDFMAANTPDGVACTTFSILFSRLKGDMQLLYAGARAIDALKPGDPVLVAEACSHHASDDDIGRVKLPRWLARKVGGPLEVSVSAGRDYPADLKQYKLILHCGSCMLNRRETLRRLHLAAAAGVPVTNYGMAISHCRGVLDRVMAPLLAKM